MDDGLYPAFRDFCLNNADALRPLVASRLVQTNEVGRSACLLPGYAEVSRREEGKRLALIDFGCSAGLNLLFDRFGYDYGPGRLRCGDAASPVQLRCELRSENTPPLQTGAPVAGWRVGQQRRQQLYAIAFDKTLRVLSHQASGGDQRCLALAVLGPDQRP